MSDKKKPSFSAPVLEPANAGPEPAFGRGYSEFPAPAGPDGSVPRNYADDSMIPLTETCCMTCVHGHIIRGSAPVRNRRPDGTAFELAWAQCLVTTPPTSLEELRPIECSRYDPTESAVRAAQKEE
jgi:hypothetical protein